MSRILSVSLLVAALVAPVRAADVFGLGVPSGEVPPASSASTPAPATPAVLPETGAVPRGFHGMEPFMETVNAIEVAAAREIRTLNVARAAQGLPPLPYDVRVSVVGSSVTGFSENPNKNRRAFGPHSDIDFLLESDTLLEAARQRKLDASKGHVHPKRLGQFLPELDAVAKQYTAKLPHDVTVGVSDSRTARTAGWSTQNIVVDVGAPRRVDGAPGPTPYEGREVLTRAEARELEGRVMEEVDRLRREAGAARQLAEGLTPTEAARLQREAVAMEAAARHMEGALTEPLRRALTSGDPIPAAEVRSRLTRYEGAKIDGVRVPVRLDMALDSISRIPEAPNRPTRTGTAGTRGRAEALAYLRQQASRHFATSEGRAAFEAYRAIEALPPETPLPELLRRPELARLSPAVRAELGRVAPRGRPGASGGRPGQSGRPPARTPSRPRPRFGR